MKYFDTYSSATLAATNTQKFYSANPDEIQRARSYVRLTVTGEHGYSFLFANQIASTFSDGSESFANYVCAPWEILSLKAAVCKEGFTPSEFFDITFEGKPQKSVASGEIFATDPIHLASAAGDRLCLEITYRGREIPYLHETMIYGERWMDGTWCESRYLPRPVMIGCDRPVRRRVVMLGDSITEGIGVPMESYAGYSQIAGSLLGEDIAVWNLGLGFGRAADAASGGLWFYEAKGADAVLVCFGVNDILKGYTEGEIKKNLSLLLRRLKAAGCLVGIQTVPPFDFSGENARVWDAVNAYVKAELAPTADFFFDNRPILCGRDGYSCPFGGHPNEEGARLWGEALAKAILQSGMLEGK